MTELEAYYNDVLIFYGKIAIVFLWIPVFVAWVKWKHLNRPLKVFHWYLMAIILNNLLAQLVLWTFRKDYESFWKPYLTAWKIDNIHFLNIIYDLIVLSFVGYFYYILLKKIQASNWLKYLICFLCLVAIINHLYIDGFRSFGIINSTITGIFVTFLPCLYLWHLNKAEPGISLSKNPYFMISLGLFVPSLISLIYLFLGDEIYKHDFVLFVKFQMVKNLIDVISQGFFIVAFWNARFVRFLDR